MSRKKNELKYTKWVEFQIGVIERIEDTGHRRKYLEFMRDYQILDRDIVDEIAKRYGLVYHKESNSYWWV